MVLIERLLFADLEALGLLGGELVVVVVAGHGWLACVGQDSSVRGRWIGMLVWAARK